MAKLEKKAEDFRAKDLYYSTNETVLAKDAKFQLLQLGHDLKDLCKEKEMWSSTNAQLIMQTQVVVDLQNCWPNRRHASLDVEALEDKLDEV